MANVLLQEQDYSFSYNSALGAFVHSLVPAPFALTEGETYTVVWDNTEYEREAYAFTTADGTACVGIGDTMVKTGVSDGDGFAIVHDVTNGYMHLLSTEQVATHKVGVFEVAVDNTQYVIKGSTLTAIAKSIRKKTGSGDKISPTAMAAAIDNISGGGGGSAEGCVTMTFNNGYTVLFTRPVYIGDDCPDPITQGHIKNKPTKAPTVDKVFTYEDGWSLTDGGSKDDNALKNVTADRTVYAAYSSTPREYTITYYDDDGSTLKTEQEAYGTVPSYTPTKDGFGFAGWTPTPTAVTGDSSYTATWSRVLYSGTITENTNISWTIDSAGVLTLVGTGAMPDYASSSDSPFYGYRSTVTKIVVSDGITRIGEWNFGYCSNVAEVVLADSVTSLGNYAFSSCSALANVVMSNSLTDLASACLNTASNKLTELRIPASVIHLGNAFVHTGYMKRLIFEVQTGWHRNWSDTPSGSSLVAITDDLSNPENAMAAFKNSGNGAQWHRV